MSIAKIGAIIVTFAEFFAFAYGLSRFSKVAECTKFIIYAIGLMFFFDLAQFIYILAEISRDVNLVTLHILSLVQYTIFTLYLACEQKNELVRKLMGFSVIVFVIFWIVSKLTFEPFTNFDNYGSATCAILLVAYAVRGMVLLGQEDGIDLFRSDRFYLILGTIIYFAGGLFFLVLYNELIGLPETYYFMVLSYHWVLVLLANLIWMKGISCSQNQ